MSEHPQIIAFRILLLNSPFVAGNNSFRPQELSPGTVILNTYEVLGLLGRGGMGAVYRVYHRYLRKEMAMKTLRADQVNQNTWLRFQAEAKAIAKLEHPNIVQIFDMGICEDGQPFYTMELLDGMGLDEWTRRNPISTMQAILFFRQVACGLAFAHERGILHRDIKPANIVLTFAETNKPPVVKLVDFGIAKLAAENQGLTKEGEVFGSPSYMSPEQASGLKVDQRSDIYSFGCALYETLTGFPPFKGKSAVETMMMHLDKVAVSIERARPEVNYLPGLSMVVQKCMAKKADERYSDAWQLAQDLFQIEQGTYVCLSKSRALAIEKGKSNSQWVLQPQAVPLFTEEVEELEVEDADSLSDSSHEVPVGGRGETTDFRKRVFFLLSSVVGLFTVLLIGRSLWESFCSGAGIFGWGQQSAEAREKISCQKLYSEIDHFYLTPADLGKLVLKEVPRANYRYYLFPFDGEGSVGRIYETTGDGTVPFVPYRAAAGLIACPVSAGPAIRLVLSPELAVNLKLLERLRADELTAVSFPLVALEGKGKAVDCALSVNQSRKLLTELRRFKCLEYINCGTASLDNDCLARFVDFPALKVLEVNEGTLVSDVALEKLPNLNKLIGLSLPNQMGPFAIFQSLDQSSKLDNITIGKYYAPEEIPANCQSLRNLRLVIFQHCHISVAVVRYLASCKNIEEINFRHSFVSKGAMPFLMKMKKLKRLTLPEDIFSMWGQKEFEAFKKARRDLAIRFEGRGRGSELDVEYWQTNQATGFDPSK